MVVRACRALGEAASSRVVKKRLAAAETSESHASTSAWV
jgi:hypothetical protein